jgi:DNA (cytosine-5)-methyltransferase 1
MSRKKSDTDTLGKALPAASLFSGAGIGDLGWRAAGLDVMAQCEIEADRAALAELNFHGADVLVADVWQAQERFVASVQARLGRRQLFLLSCTAPCQGMSKSGQGTLLNNVRAGKRPTFDPRNRLVLPALQIIKALRPRWVVFENVVEMRNTLIQDEANQTRPILDVIFQTLAPEYVGAAYDVEFADYGVAQRRQRLITVLTRDRAGRRRFEQGASLVPPATHGRVASEGLKRWVSVSEALADYPPLDGLDERNAVCAERPFHRVPVIEPKKYEWIRHARPGRSAFDNQCVNPNCGFQGNRTHGAGRDGQGINRARRDTPLFCEKCGLLLPRPYVEEGGVKRLMSGYASAYKRMDGDLPAPALTRNLSYACSDSKLHPTQNRVLSLADAMTLHTIDRYEYRWGPIVVRRGKRERTEEVASGSLMRLVIGESVPPLYFERLGAHLRALSHAGCHGVADTAVDALPLA